MRQNRADSCVSQLCESCVSALQVTASEGSGNIIHGTEWAQPQLSFSSASSRAGQAHSSLLLVGMVHLRADLCVHLPQGEAHPALHSARPEPAFYAAHLMFTSMLFSPFLSSVFYSCVRLFCPSFSSMAVGCFSQAFLSFELSWPLWSEFPLLSSGAHVRMHCSVCGEFLHSEDRDPWLVQLMQI